MASQRYRHADPLGQPGHHRHELALRSAAAGPGRSRDLGPELAVGEIDRTDVDDPTGEPQF
jgi:hypothetical protein